MDFIFKKYLIIYVVFDYLKNFFHKQERLVNCLNGRRFDAKSKVYLSVIKDLLYADGCFF